MLFLFLEGLRFFPVSILLNADATEPSQTEKADTTRSFLMESVTFFSQYTVYKIRGATISFYEMIKKPTITPWKSNHDYN